VTVSNSGGHETDGHATRSEVQRILYEVIIDILPGLQLDKIDQRQHLIDLGADSVDRVEIITMAIERLGVNKSASAFSTTRDIGGLLDGLAAAKRT